MSKYKMCNICKNWGRLDDEYKVCKNCADYIRTLLNQGESLENAKERVKQARKSKVKIFPGGFGNKNN